MLNNPKIAGFLRGLLYAIIGVTLTYVDSNLGTSGIVSTATAGFITALIGVLEAVIQNKTGAAVFGAIK